MFFDLRQATLPELCLANGRRADLTCLDPKGKVTIVEIKSSIDDFRSDHKWPDYKAHCDAFYFATLPDVPPGIFPEAEGLIVADQYGAEIIRPPADINLSGARRKAVVQRFAVSAAERLLQAELTSADIAALPKI